MDYDPGVIGVLSRQKINCIYGDGSDEEFLDSLNLKKTRMIVSTMPDFETNQLLINKIRKLNKKSIIIVISHNISEAKALYGDGASYVIMPHFLGGKHVSYMIRRHGLNHEKFLWEKNRHILHLSTREKLGHEHPKIQKNK